MLLGKFILFDVLGFYPVNFGFLYAVPQRSDLVNQCSGNLGHVVNHFIICFIYIQLGLSRTSTNLFVYQKRWRAANQVKTPSLSKMTYSEIKLCPHLITQNSNFILQKILIQEKWTSHSFWQETSCLTQNSPKHFSLRTIILSYIRSEIEA